MEILLPFSELGQVTSYTHCAYFNIKALTNSGSTKVTLSYLEPSSGRTLRAHTTITVFSPLEVVYPVKEKLDVKPTILLPIGSSSKLVLTGGPRPWHGMPTAHFKQSMYIHTLNWVVIDDKGALIFKIPKGGGYM